MSLPIALAVPGLGCESQVIAGAEAHGLEVRRRCVDAADLLGACLGAPGLTAVITAELPRLSADVIDRLHHSASKVIAIAVHPDDRAGLEALGVDAVIESCDPPSELISGIAAAIQGEEPLRGVWNLERTATASRDTPDAGRVIAVWGPAGAPGRTTTALVLSQCLAEHSRTLVIDADTTAPSLALQLGLTDDLSGIILACRHAETGNLTSRSLESCLNKISNSYFALTGLIHSRRVTELRPAALARVLERVRSDFAFAVIDIGAEIGSPASAATLAVADVVVAVCRAEPLGAARFLADLPELAAHGVPLVCVITGGGQGRQAQQLIRDAALRLGISIPISDLSLDAQALTNALRKARTVRRLRRTARRAGAARLAELVA